MQHFFAKKHKNLALLQKSHIKNINGLAAFSYLSYVKTYARDAFFMLIVQNRHMREELGSLE